MILGTYKPSILPQVSAPFKYVLKQLKNDGVGCKLASISPTKLMPSQGIVYSDKVSELKPDMLKPIWVSNDNYVLDGHHRFASALSNENPYIKVIKIDLNRNDAVRLLNKIMDIYEYSNQEKMEEVVAQNVINVANDPNTDPANFLEMLDDENKEELLLLDGKKKKVTAYRKEPVRENSQSGNFFSIKPIDGYKEYEIEFDNLLETNDMGITFYRDKNPTLVLADNWFPNIDFKKVAKKHDVEPDILINRAVCDKARKMGYDGIKYGDIMVQGLN